MPRYVLGWMLGLLFMAGSTALLTGCTGGDRVELLLAAAGAPTDEVMERARAVMERRIAAVASSRATVARQGRNRILVTLGARADAERVKALVGRAGRLEFRLVDVKATPEQIESGEAPPGSEILPLRGGGPEGRIAVRSRRIVTGAMIADAQQAFDANAQPVVSITFDAVGARRFALATQDNVGRAFAIVLDDDVISAPVINEPILGGQAQISGDFTVEEAERMAIALRSGPLPVDFVLVEERVVAE